MTANQERNEIVLALAGRGYSYGEIAQELGISRHAVAGVMYRTRDDHCPRGERDGLTDDERALVQALLTPHDQRTPEQYDLVQAAGAAA